VKYILKRWQDSWDQQIHNKLHEMHSLVGKTNRLQIMNLLFSEEATNFKARSIALASALKIELADGIRAE
jgi:hypothetical protein